MNLIKKVITFSILALLQVVPSMTAAQVRPSSGGGSSGGGFGGGSGGGGGLPSSSSYQKAIVRIPTDGAGDGSVAQGVVALLTWSSERYTEGVPVIVEVTGGFASGELELSSRPEGYANEHFVHIRFLFPGGSQTDPLTGTTYTSGGSYDYRGDNCKKALRDILKFAGGLVQAQVINSTIASTSTTDMLNISQITQLNVLTSNVGVIGMSNGGNTVATTFAKYGDELGHVQYYVSFESPYGRNMVVGELGEAFSGAGELNSAYRQRSCSESRRAGLGVCKMDYSVLNLGDDTEIRDGDSNMIGVSTTSKKVYFANADGNYEMIPYGVRLTAGGDLIGMYSFPLIKSLYKKLGASAYPSTLASPLDAQIFWSERDATWNDGQPIKDALSKMPHLKIMVNASRDDHGQLSPDHPHIRNQMLGWTSNGASWARLNADAAYIEEQGYHTSVDNAANDANSFSWDSLVGETVLYVNSSADRTVDASTGRSDLVPFYEGQMPAAICEMADRVQNANWDTNLAAPLTHL